MGNYGIPITNENDYNKITSKNRIHGGHLELNASTNIFNIFITIFH